MYSNSLSVGRYECMKIFKYCVSRILCHRINLQRTPYLSYYSSRLSDGLMNHEKMIPTSHPKLKSMRLYYSFYFSCSYILCTEKVNTFSLSQNNIQCIIVCVLNCSGTIRVVGGRGLRLVELRSLPEGVVFHHWEFLQDTPPTGKKCAVVSAFKRIIAQ